MSGSTEQANGAPRWVMIDQHLCWVIGKDRDGQVICQRSPSGVYSPILPSEKVKEIAQPGPAATIYEWMREPDYAEKFSLSDLLNWMEKRPTAEVRQLLERERREAEQEARR